MSRSRKAAIDQHCRDCIFDRYARGTWRQQVEKCTSYGCALYPFRPTPTVTPSKGKILESSARIESICAHTEPARLKDASL